VEEFISKTKMKSIKVYSIILGNCKFSVFWHLKDILFSFLAKIIITTYILISPTKSSHLLSCLHIICVFPEQWFWPQNNKPNQTKKQNPQWFLVSSNSRLLIEFLSSLEPLRAPYPQVSFQQKGNCWCFTTHQENRRNEFCFKYMRPLLR
jgi:hypothetical protein